MSNNKEIKKDSQLDHTYICYKGGEKVIIVAIDLVHAISKVYSN